MSATQILSAAATLINSSDKWCQHTCAVNSQGRYVGALNSDAVKFDLFGSIQRAAHNLGLPLSDFHLAYASLKAAIPAGVKNRDIELYNDKVDYATVIAMLNGTPILLPDTLRTSDGNDIVTADGNLISISSS